MVLVQEIIVFIKVPTYIQCVPKKKDQSLVYSNTFGTLPSNDSKYNQSVRIENTPINSTYT